MVSLVRERAGIDQTTKLLAYGSVCVALWLGCVELGLLECKLSTLGLDFDVHENCRPA
jgi:hypothetical protein